MKTRHVLEGRPIGHPLHTMLTHLPLGLWLLGLAFDALSYVFSGEYWPVHGAFWSLLLGTIAAVPTAITGFNDFLGVRDDHPAQMAILWHMGLNIAAAGLFAVATGVHWAFIEYAPVPVGVTILTAAAYGIVMVSSYLGGVIVYNHGVSVGRHRRLIELPPTTVMPGEVLEGAGASLLADFTVVADEGELVDGQTLRAEVDGYVITVAKHNGRLFAFQEFCTHRCGPLSEGTMENDQIQCPWHSSRFDMHTGRVTAGPAKVPLKTFEVRVSDGKVLVRVPKDRKGQAPQSEKVGDLGRPKVGERRNPADDQAARERDAGRPASERTREVQ